MYLFCPYPSYSQTPPHPYTNNYWPILIFMDFSILVAYVYFPINVILPVFNFVKWNKVYYMYSSITWYIIWHCTVSPILLIYRIQIHLLSKIISIFILKLTFIFAEWWSVYFWLFIIVINAAINFYTYSSVPVRDVLFKIYLAVHCWMIFAHIFCFSRPQQNDL